MNDKEMLTMAYGAISVSTDENLQLIRDTLQEYLFGYQDEVIKEEK